MIIYYVCICICIHISHEMSHPPIEALFEVVSSEPQQTKEVGAMLCAHLATDGFQADQFWALGDFFWVL